MPPHPDRRTFLTRAATLGGAAALTRLVPGWLAPVMQPLAAAAPPIITRAQWGADERLRFRSEPPRYHPIRKFVVHHTATPNGDGDGAARMRSIFLSHLHRRSEDGTPWQDVGYNFVVDEGGRVYEGRWARDYSPGEVHDGEDPYRRGVRGAHAGEWNGGSVGIAITGTYDGRRPSEASLDAVARLIAWKCARHGLDPAGVEPWSSSDGRTRLLPTIVGHRDVRSTRCPGQGAYDALPELRRRVADILRDTGGTRADVSGGPGGYRIVHETGNTTTFGSARDLGDLARRGIVTTVAGGATLAGRDAYWLTDADGGVHGFGDASYHGSLPELRRSGVTIGWADISAMGSPGPGGYWLLDRNGGVFAFGDATFFGSVPALRQAGVRIGEADTVAIEATPSGRGYWVLDRNGGVFAFGDATFFGSVPALRQAGVDVGEIEVVDLRAHPGGQGYWVLDRRGGVFAFGSAPFHGSVPGTGFLGGRATRLVPTAGGRGYHVLSTDGGVMAFGDAVFHGYGPHVTSVDLIPTP